MHQHISTHDRNPLLLQDPPDLIPVRDHNLDLLTILLSSLTNLTTGIPINRSTGFIRHPDRRKIRLLKSLRNLDRLQLQPGLLKHLPHSTLMEILPRLHKPRRKLINIPADRIPILTDQHNLIPLLSINTVNDHPIRMILPCRKLHILHTLRPGGHKIRNRRIMYTGRIHSIKIHELIICKFFHTIDLTHLKNSFPKIFSKNILSHPKPKVNFLYLHSLHNSAIINTLL